MKFTRSSSENIYFLSALIPIAIIISSNSGNALLIISTCPNVIGSKDPGKIALLIF